MTLPNKGSRTITVDNLVYRWKPSPMRWYEPPMMSFVAHLDGIPRDMKALYSTLEVTMWERHCSIITPQIAANLIQGHGAAGGCRTSPSRDPTGLGQTRPQRLSDDTHSGTKLIGRADGGNPS